jgi:hypothetical protein
VGGQERAVGLQHHPVEGDDRAGGPQPGGVAEGDRARERHIPAGLDHPAGGLLVAGEAVEHRPRRRALAVEDGQHVGERVAAVHHQRLVELAGEQDMGREGGPLELAGRVVAVVVQPRLPHPDHPLGGQQPA